MFREGTEVPGGEEESIKQVVTIAEEFLHLTLMVTGKLRRCYARGLALNNTVRFIGERWVPGVGEATKEDAIRREVIHMLCKGPAPYSKLDKNLPEDHLEKTGLEQVIRSVADFR